MEGESKRCKSSGRKEEQERARRGAASSTANRVRDTRATERSESRSTSTALSSNARQARAYIAASWQDLTIASGRSHARYARALGPLRDGSISFHCFVFYKNVGVCLDEFVDFSRFRLALCCRMFKSLSFLQSFRALEKGRERKREREREREREKERERERKRERGVLTKRYVNIHDL